MYLLSPQVDIAFKKIFGVEENKDLLISLINSIVSTEDQVQDVTLLNPYNPRNFREDKLSILDIKAQGLDGKMFNIKIQITDEADYDKRALYYWAKLYTEQLKKSARYSNLTKAIGIHILNFLSIPESNKYHNVFHITEKENGFNYFKDLELHTIELRKFVDSIKDDKQSDLLSKTKTALDAWVAFLTKYDLLDKNNLPNNLKAVGLDKALDVLEVLSFNEAEREEYEEHLKWLRMEMSAIEKAEEKGIEKGIQEGIEIGQLEGKKTKAVEIAKKMLANGYNSTDIYNITGISLHEK